jgi:hypothetical protein
MGHMGRFTKTPYLLLFVILAGAGIGTAYAGIVLPTITLGGNVIVTGDTELEGKLVDTNDEAGTSGQVLSSTEAGIDWVDATGSDTLGNLACSTDQVTRFDGSQWVCNNIVLQSQLISTTITTVDATGIVGVDTSIAIGTDGFPVISYFDDTNDDLKVAKCVNAECTGTSTKTTVDSTGIVGAHTSIAIGNDGFPVISYNDDTNDDLKVAKCVNAACTGVSTLTAVDTAGSVGQHTSIVIGNDGFPVISYYDNTNFVLKVAKCVNAACTGTSTITTVDATGGAFTSIAIGTDGFPVISYQDFTNIDLKVAKCVNAACTGTSTKTIVDSAGNVGRFTSIAIGNDGFPVISHQDFTNIDLKVAKCVNAACTGTSTITTVDATGLVGWYTSIAIGNDGFPVISYLDTTNDDLKVAKCVNAACTGASIITIVDATGVVGDYTSIAIGTDGFPVISYSDLTNGDLKVFKQGGQSFTIGFN